jgi:hypothetical protein
MKTTSNGRRPQISKLEYLSNHLWDPSKILNLSLGDQIILYEFFKWRRTLEEDNLQLKATTNIKSGISQQPFIGSFSNFELKLIWPKYIS